MSEATTRPAATYTNTELLAVSTSRLLSDGRVVFAGVGMPLLAAALAHRTHAPNLTIVLEGGIIGCSMTPGDLPISTNEMRAARQSMMLTDITEIFLYAQRGYFDYGLLGGAQIDRHGNINTSLIGDRATPQVRLPGSGGANDIASACRETYIVTMHEPRRFVERVDFVTSPGYLEGGHSRERAGLLFGGPTYVLTDLALMDFTADTRQMRVIGLQPGATLAAVRAATGFELLVADRLDDLARPTDDELMTLRMLDPARLFLG